MFIAVMEFAMNLTQLAASLVVLGTFLGFGAVPSFTSTARAQVLAHGMGTNVEVLKDDLIARLSECETRGKGDPDTLITREANGELSVGRLQFQTRTVIPRHRDRDGRARRHTYTQNLAGPK